MRSKKQAPKPLPPPRRATITVDLGEACLTMLDEVVSLLRSISIHRRGTKAITRSYAVRQAVERLWDALMLKKEQDAK